MRRMASYSVLNHLLGVNRCNSTRFLALSSYFSISAFLNPVLLGFLSLAFAQHILQCQICFCLNLQTTIFPPAVALTGDTSGHVCGIRTFGTLVGSGKAGRKQARVSPKKDQQQSCAGRLLLWQLGSHTYSSVAALRQSRPFFSFLGVCSSTGHFIHSHVNYPSSSLTSIHCIS